MPKQNVALQAFNRGIISSRALARMDIERVGMSAEICSNWMPETIGPMSLRPGTGLVGSIPAPTYLIPFHRSTNDVALLEFTAGSLRIWRDDALVTRPTPAGTINNSDFSSGLTGWTDSSEATATASVTSGVLSLVGTGFAEAKIRQQVSAGGGAVRLSIARGRVKVRIGTASGLADIYDETLDAGEHSLVVDSAFHIELASDLQRAVLVNSVSMESAGVLSLPAFTSITWLRYAQSADVVYMATDGGAPKKVERRNNNSWSITEYLPDAGPFNLINNTSTTLTPSDLAGNITLTASRPLFEAKHVGQLFRLDSSSQTVSAVLSGENQWTDDIRTSGVGVSRAFTVTVSGDATGIVTVQVSVGGPGNWEKYIESPDNGSYAVANDDLDGQIVHYRIGIQSGNYSSGNRTVQIEFDGGSSSGTVRVTSVTSATSAQAEVLQTLGNAESTADWYEGAWADAYPSSVELHEGRLWWFGKNRIWSSVSDDYLNLDTETEGDSGPIDRTIGKGPVNRIHWAVGVQRLLLGTSGNEISVRSSSLDEPVTPTNFNQKPSSSQGSHSTDAIAIDDDVLFVQRSEKRLYYLTIDGGDYKPFDLTLMQPEIAISGIKRVAVQRQPDTRVHCILNDGTVSILLFNEAENVRCWTRFVTDGLVEDVCVLPGTTEDQVYYVVNREGSRYLEKWTHQGEYKLADSHVIATGPTVAGLDHLEGKTVVAWSLASDRDLGTFVVSGGQVTLPGTESCVVGLPYTAQYKSTKLAYAAGMGTALAQRKDLEKLALIMHNTHAKGLSYGPNFAEMDSLPDTEDWADVADDFIHSSYDFDAIPFDSRWNTDARLCLQASAPRPCTMMAAIVTVNTRDKA